MKGIIFIFVLFMSSAYAAAEDTPSPMPLDTQEQAAQINRALTALDNYKASINQFVADKTAECMKAIGNPDFCSCIANKSPGNISFVGYVQIVTKTKEELEYDSLTPEHKKMVDLSRTARDQCVNWKGKH
jgi:hypothetical protein